MAPTLRIEGEELHLSLSGSESFQRDLQLAKTIEGRRYDPETREWVYEATADNAMRLVQMIRLSPEATVMELVREHAAEIADGLARKLPDDAPESSTIHDLPWAEKMYPYQRAASVWLGQNPHAILADDMGLGKTIEAITAVKAAQHKTNLVIAPKSMKLTWAEELWNWTRTEATVVNSGEKKSLSQQVKSADTEWTIINWEMLQRRAELVPTLKEISWEAQIADEAHRMKNREAQQSVALLGHHANVGPKGEKRPTWRGGLRAPMQLCLTGTPILNSPDELFSLLAWLEPDSYTSYWSFFEDHVHYFEGYYGRIITGVKNVPALQFALRNILVRRSKSQVLKDLPAKLPRQVIEVELRPEQQKPYEQATNELMLEIEQFLTEDGITEAHRAERAKLIESGSLERIMLSIPNAGAKIARQRQIALSPALLGGKDKSSKLDAAVEIITDHPEHQYVVFCHHKGAAELLADRIRRISKSQTAALTLTGDTSQAKRQGAIHAFQAGEARVIVCTIRAGGQGITLTASSTCIFIEEDWTEALNVQAEDRLHRIGQENPVQAIRIRARGTVDTGKIAPTLRIKELMAAAIVGVA